MARRKKKAKRRKTKARKTKRKTKKRKTKAKKTKRRRPKARKTKRKTKRRTKAKKGKKKSKRKANSAFMKPLAPTAILAAIVGSKKLPRTEATKRIWRYIKRNKLQDRINRRMIKADAKLKKLFRGKGKVSMFELTKHVSRNLINK